MKKIIAVMMLCLSVGAHAHGQWHHGGGYRGGHGWGWVAPVVVGGVIGYEMARPAPVIVQQPPVVVQPPRIGYLCRPANAFYPAVQTCPIPWEQVSY